MRTTLAQSVRQKLDGPEGNFQRIRRGNPEVDPVRGYGSHRVLARKTLLQEEGKSLRNQVSATQYQGDVGAVKGNLLDASHPAP